MTSLRNHARIVRSLADEVATIDRQTRVLGDFAEGTADWRELLTRKLLPQLSDDAWLVVAVVGGTNIGKSVIFNHLAGSAISASSPLASGTKHPVLVCPESFTNEHDLSAIFPDFTVLPWNSADESLKEDSRHCLFWRTTESARPNLLLLDTPDIDSDAPVNWERADAVRQAADVLVAVLTQQKYNDAAVKQFFRKAAAEDKVMVIVFNRVDLPDDEEWWPKWLETFCQETGAHPEAVFLAPNDRRAADRLALPFFDRTAGKSSPEPASLSNVLSDLRFGEIKLRTLRGSIQQLIGPEGLPGWLASIRGRSAEFQSAADLLATHRLAEIRNWPVLPNAVMLREIRQWWANNRTGWTATIHTAYDKVGNVLLTPFTLAKNWVQPPGPPPIEDYRHREWAVIVETIEHVFQKLEWLSELGNPLLTNRLSEILSGKSRADLLSRWDREHSELDFSKLAHEVVARELAGFREENPAYYRFFQQLDIAAAAGRPALTIALGITGIGLPFGEAATQLASTAIMQSALHVTGDVIGGATVATVGDAAINTAAGTTSGYLQARFRRLQEVFASERTAWLAERLERDLLGELAKDWREAAAIPTLPSLKRVDDLVKELRQTLNADDQA